MNKLNLLKQAGMVVALVISIAGLSGCVAAAVTGAAAAGGAGAAYVMGTLRSDVQATPTRIAEATRRAFGTYVIKVEEYKTTELDALVVGHTANDKRIKVTVKRETDLISELSIQVGTFGDEAFSNLLYEEIKKQLSQGGSSGAVASYAVPMTSAPTSVAVPSASQPAPPSLEPAPAYSAPSNTPPPSSGTPVAY
ncbi:MAG: DUF3568 family protein [Gammaproteobacteria bacterium]